MVLIIEHQNKPKWPIPGIELDKIVNQAILKGFTGIINYFRPVPLLSWMPHYSAAELKTVVFNWKGEDQIASSRPVFKENGELLGVVGAVWRLVK